MQQQVLKPFPEPGHVFRVLGRLAQFTPGQNVRRQPFQMKLDCLRCNRKQRPADEMAFLPVRVLAVAHAVVPFLRARPVRALAVLQDVASSGSALGVCHQGGRPSCAEEAIHQEHRPVVADVPALRDVLVRDDDNLGAFREGGEQLLRI